jgi:hypothetical protein
MSKMSKRGNCDKSIKIWLKWWSYNETLDGLSQDF